MNPILTINGTKKGQFECMVLKAARGQENLEGSLCTFQIPGTTSEQEVLAAVGQIETSNPKHDDDRFAPLIMEKGQLAYFSGATDIERCTLLELACTAQGALAQRAANPASGTLIYPITSPDLIRFADEKEYYLNIGYLPKTTTLVSVKNRDFGPIGTGKGWGFAKHTLLAGQNGSWKTVTEQMRLAGQLVQHHTMGCLIPDIAGDFYIKDKHNLGGSFRFDFQTLLTDGGRAFDRIPLLQLRLTTPDFLKKKLTSLLKQVLSCDDDKARQLVTYALEEIGMDSTVPVLTPRTLTDLFDAVETILTEIPLWTDERQSKKQPEGTPKNATRLGIFQRMREPSRIGRWERFWEQDVLPLYTGEYTTQEVARWALYDQRLVILGLNQATPEQKEALMFNLFKEVADIARKNYHADKPKAVNCKLVIDEGPTWVPQKGDSEIGAKLIEYATQMRKYNVGLDVMTQRLADIHNEIISQSHTKYFGWRLRTGADKTHIEEQLGKDGRALYERLDARNQPFFLIRGDDVNVGYGAAPIPVIPFGGDATKALEDNNPHIWRKSGW